MTSLCNDKKTNKHNKTQLIKFIDLRDQISIKGHM